MIAWLSAEQVLLLADAGVELEGVSLLSVDLLAS